MKRKAFLMLPFLESSNSNAVHIVTLAASVVARFDSSLWHSGNSYGGIK